jgi:methanogenic corrinoid protein MtbC1
VFPKQSNRTQGGNIVADDFFGSMRQSIVEGDPDRTRDLSQQALAKGISPQEAINHGFVPGLNAVGEQFAAGEMFLPDLVLAVEAIGGASVKRAAQGGPGGLQVRISLASQSVKFV